MTESDHRTHRRCCPTAINILLLIIASLFIFCLSGYCLFLFLLLLFIRNPLAYICIYLRFTIYDRIGSEFEYIYVKQSCCCRYLQNIFPSFLSSCLLCSPLFLCVFNIHIHFVSSPSSFSPPSHSRCFSVPSLSFLFSSSMLRFHLSPFFSLFWELSNKHLIIINSLDLKETKRQRMT